MKSKLDMVMVKVMMMVTVITRKFIIKIFGSYFIFVNRQVQQLSKAIGAFLFNTTNLILSNALQYGAEIDLEIFQKSPKARLKQ